MKKWRLLMTTAAIGGVVLAGCSSSNASPVTVKQTIEGMNFGQKELTLQNGQPVTLVLENKDSLQHDFSIDKIPGKVKEEHGAMHDMGGKKPDVHVSVDAGKTGEVTFTPTAPGTYTFYCTVPGHRDAGMQGQLVVK